MSTSEHAAGIVATRELILAAATTLFGERDYPATSIRDIAREVDLLPGRIYNYIESKEAILYEIVSAGIEQFITAVRALDAEVTAPEERLARAIEAHIDIVAENPERALVVFHQWRYLGDDNRVKVVASRGQYEEFFRGTIGQGIDAGVFRKDLNIRYATLSVLGALNWAPEWIHTNDSSSSDHGRNLATILLAGLLAHEVDSS